MASRARLVAGAFVVLLVAACSGTPQRPTPGPGKAVRVVERDRLVAMAVDPDGTLWLVHDSGDVYRAGSDGKMSLAREFGAPQIHERAAATVGPDGSLYLVSDASRDIIRLNADDLHGERTGIEPIGLPTEPVAFTGVAVGRDGAVYVSDGRSGVVFRVGSDKRAVAVPGTPLPDARCTLPREFPPYPIGLILTAADQLVVADPGCPALYRPQQGPIADPVDCPNSKDGGAWPSTVAEMSGGRLVVGARFCELVWQVLPGGAGETLAGRDDLRGLPRAMGTDRTGTVYVLDEAGVLALRPPGQASHG